MLYLKRKIGERILINETVEMTVIEIKGKMVRLGFTNPPGTTVRRIPTEKTAKKSAEPATVATEKQFSKFCTRLALDTRDKLRAPLKILLFRASSI